MADPEFDLFWDTHKGVLPMELAVPDVVVGELNFQQTTSATKLLDKVITGLDEISGIVATRHATRLTREDVKAQVSAKIEKWLKAKSATELKAPVDSIDWRRLIHASIWRLQPFTYDAKKPEVEKGFRDAIILETLVNTADRARAEEKNVIFLCKDQLLRTTAVEMLKTKQNAICFESLKDFEGYIKLTQEKLTSSFVTQIQNRARARFYTPSDETSLYLKKKVPALLLEKFSNELEISPPTPASTSGLLSLGKSKWQHKSTKRWIGSTTFEKLEQPRTYHWITKVTATKLFREVFETGQESYVETKNEQILVCIFDVKWSADVKADGRFLDLDVNDILLVGRSIDVATAESVEKYGLGNNTTPW